MNVIFYLLIILVVVIGMEFMAWFVYKYIMYGFLWNWYEDYYKFYYEKDGFFEKNDLFFLVFVILSVIFYIVGLAVLGYFWLLFVGIGIFIYGMIYFLIYDVYIYQCFKWFWQFDSKYFCVILWVYGVYYVKCEKEDGEFFGLLIVNLKYFCKCSEWVKEEAKVG